METTTNPIGFEYLNLLEVDPNNSIPTAIYPLRLTSAELKPHTFGPTSKRPGEEGSKIQFKFTVLGDSAVAGRQVNSTLFESSMSPVCLRKLMDATGVAQLDGEAFTSWLARLADTGPDFKVMVEKNDRGNEVKYLTARPND